MNVVIVGKTRMHGGICIGGLVASSGQSVRIIPAGLRCNPNNTQFQLGQIWDLDLRPMVGAVAPHVEDHEFTKSRLLGTESDLKRWILSKVTPWQGSPAALFDGALQFRPRGTGFVPTTGNVSRVSTGFWILPSAMNYCPFRKDDGSEKPQYALAAGATLILPYVGFQPTLPSIPAGSLVRLSLARPWTGASAPPGEDQRHSLQLSGWYLT